MSASDKGSGEAKRPLRDGIDDARHHAVDAAHAASGRAREIAHDAVASGRETAQSAREGIAATIENNPIASLAGGIALGALLGAVIPRSDRETAMLGAVGERLIDAARDALDAARAAGRDKLDEAGLSRDGARDAVRGVIDSALAAAFSAGNAAAEAAKQSVIENHD